MDPLQPAAAAKATGEILPKQKYKGQRATTADQVQVKGELLPEAGRPEDDTVQGGQSAGSGEFFSAQRKATAQADTLRVASEPSRKRAMAEHGKLESAQDAGGGGARSRHDSREDGRCHRLYKHCSGGPTAQNKCGRDTSWRPCWSGRG